MKLQVFKRDVFGKSVRSLRKYGIVPAIVYGKSLKEPLAVSFNKLDFLKLYKEV
jgi:ribosomal protein L25 (general stress protein Ctc)